MLVWKMPQNPSMNLPMRMDGWSRSKWAIAQKQTAWWMPLLIRKWLAISAHFYISPQTRMDMDGTAVFELFAPFFKFWSLSSWTVVSIGQTASFPVLWHTSPAMVRLAFFSKTGTLAKDDSHDSCCGKLRSVDRSPSGFATPRETLWVGWYNSRYHGRHDRRSFSRALPSPICPS